MNIQIFGTSKSFDTKKAQRYFSERKIKFQYVDLRERQLSKGEWNSVKSAVGGWEKLFDENSKNKELVTLVKYLTPEAKEEKIFENQELLKMPIVRNSKQATVGYAPEIWQTWE